MSKRYKINVKTCRGIIVAAYLLILTFYVQAYGGHRKSFVAYLTQYDTVPVKPAKDTIVISRSRTIRADSSVKKLGVDSIIVIDTLKISKDSIDVPIKYHADDSGVLIIPTRQFLLYGKARTEYKDLKLEAATIQYEQRTETVKAYGSTDSTGNLSAKPQFKIGRAHV